MHVPLCSCCVWSLRLQSWMPIRGFVAWFRWKGSACVMERVGLYRAAWKCKRWRKMFYWFLFVIIPSITPFFKRKTLGTWCVHQENNVSHSLRKTMQIYDAYKHKGLCQRCSRYSLKPAFYLMTSRRQLLELYRNLWKNETITDFIYHLNKQLKRV